MTIRAIDISKLALYGIFLNYYFYFIIRGSFIPMGTYIFLAVAVIGVIVTMGKKPKKLDFEIKCWIWYFVYSIVTIVIAQSTSDAVDGLVKFFQRTLFIILITLICEYEKSINFALRLMAVTAVACAAATLMNMNDYSQKLTVESGANVSTNDIGSIMAFGCFAILFAFGVGNKSKAYKTIMKIAFIIAAIAVISIAGSRKSILAIIIMFAAMFILCGRDYFKRMTSVQFMGIVILGLVALYFVYSYLLPYFEDTNLYVRMFGRGAERTAESDDGRWELYASAMNEFLSHFLFGLGFNNYIYQHGMYTHSTYVEPLACSGIFGLLYLIPYISILYKQIKLSFSKDAAFSKTNRVFQKEMLAFYIAFLFVGIGIPYLYKDIPCIILAMYISWQRTSLDELGLRSYKKNKYLGYDKITDTISSCS
ncbi:MAG: O-antigen ligase family protein [Eubacteriales bacterium]|nr:O-antigen ligase family protein [Eubacteriales bacterium]